MDPDDFSGPGMRLAQADGGGGGGGVPGGIGGPGGPGTLASSAADKRRAAAYLQDHLLQDTASAGRMAAGGGPASLLLVQPAPTPSILRLDTGLKGLSGWATEAGLSSATGSWQGAVNRLLNRLGAEKQALLQAKGIFRSDDLGASSQLNSVPVDPPTDPTPPFLAPSPGPTSPFLAPPGRPAPPLLAPPPSAFDGM